MTLGLFWDYYDQCWRCILCGYRKYQRSERPWTKAEIVAERIWDEVLDALEREELEQTGVSYRHG